METEKEKKPAEIKEPVKEPVQEVKPAEEPKKDVLDEIIETGKTPKDKSVGDILKEEADRVNKEVEAEDKGEKKPEPEEKKPAEKPDPIFEELKKKYNGKIPENIKTLDALIDWGPNAEGALRKAISEKDKSLNLSEKAEERLKKLEEAFAAKKPEAETEEEKQEAAILEEKIKILMDPNGESYNPLKAFELRDEALQKKVLKQKQKDDNAKSSEYLAKKNKEIKEGFERDLPALAKEYEDRGEKDVYAKEVLPEIAKIAKEYENAGTPLYFVEHVHAIYLQRKAKAEAKSNAEDEAKRKEKQEIGSEASHKSAGEVGGSEDEKLAEKIENYDGKSIAELNKLAGVK